MKTSRIIYLIALILLFSCNQESTETKTEAPTSAEGIANGFDAELAAELGADEYGMKSYVFAFLKRGPNRDLNPNATADLMDKHLGNIRRMAEMGKLVLAGPFLDDEDIRGIYIFDVRTVEEAAELTNTDPAIQEGYLVMDLHPWYGSAALLKLNDWHSRIAEKNP